MIPLLCIIFIKKGKPGKKVRFKSFVVFLRKMYRKVLFQTLRFKYTALIIIILLFFVSLKLFANLPVIFFPPSDRLIFKVEIELAPGTTISATEDMVKKIEDYIDENLLYEGDKSFGISERFKKIAEGAVLGEEEIKGVQSYVTHIGNGGPRFLINHKPEIGLPNYALMIVNVTKLSLIPHLRDKLENFILQNFPDADLKITRIQNGPPVTDPVQIRISGTDSDKVFDIVNKVKNRLESMKGPENIVDNWGRKTKKLIVNVDYPKARRAGVSSKDIAMSLYTAVSGFEMTEFREEDSIIPVLLKTDEFDKNSVDRLESLAVYSSLNGNNVPLRQVADLELEWEHSQINRRDRKKTVTVSSALKDGYTAEQIISSIEPWLKNESRNWGIGYKYAFGGEVEESAKANQSIMEKVPLCGFIILMILIFQFNSMRRTLIIISAIPMSVIGIVAGLYAMDLYFGFMTLLGIVSLAGIVINNAIVLLERIKVEISSGHEDSLAVIYACERRMRPILLTTATTILGVLPLYFGGGEIWEPMVVSIIAGLGFSTILTLGVVPMLYSIFFGIKYHGDELEKMGNINSEFS
jgi:multidrug efflux pump subunit AcrB